MQISFQYLLPLVSFFKIYKYLTGFDECSVPSFTDYRAKWNDTVWVPVWPNIDVSLIWHFLNRTHHIISISLLTQTCSYDSGERSYHKVMYYSCWRLLQMVRKQLFILQNVHVKEGSTAIVILQQNILRLHIFKKTISWTSGQCRWLKRGNPTSNAV